MPQEPVPLDENEDRIGVSTFGAKEIELQVLSQHARDILMIPETEENGINSIRGGAQRLVELANEILMFKQKGKVSPQLDAIFDVLNCVSNAYAIATCNGGFEERSFVISLGMDTADVIARAEAAKELGYAKAHLPDRYFDIVMEETSPLVDPLKAAFDIVSRADKWSEMLKKARQQEIAKLQRKIEQPENT